MSNERTILKLLIISGRSGSGKSSMAYEVCHLLKEQKIPHAHIDGDNLDTMYPSDNTPEVMLTNLKLIWSTYWVHFDSSRRKDVHNRFFVVVLDGTAVILHMQRIVEIFAEVVHSVSPLPEVSDPVDIQVVPLLLEASDETAGARLRSREIGSALDEHLNSSMRMSQTLQLQDENIQRMRTDSRSVSDLAHEALAHLDVEVAQ